jgi:hypothetical protein
MILTYLLFGVIFTFLIDMLINYLYYLNVSLIDDMEWDNLQRFFCVLLWPFALVIFVIAFLRKYFE